MMNKNEITRIHYARVQIAKVLLLEYPDAENMNDLPQELVDSFNELTRILLNYGLTGPAKFGIWWNCRQGNNEDAIDSVGQAWLDALDE